MKNISFTKLRQLEKHAKRLKTLIQKNRFQSLSTKKRQQLIRKVERLRGYLSNHPQTRSVKRVLAAATVALGMAITPLSAQTSDYLPAQVNPFGLTSVANAPNLKTVGDLDDDGDLDILAGDLYGVFHYYQNTGDSTTPAFATPQATPFGLPGANSYFRSPTLVDIDDDGDLDILSAEYSGLFYYENTGTSTAPTFAAPVNNPFGLTNPTYNLHVSAVDLDDDGDLDLLMGLYGGDMVYFQNTGSATMPQFGAGVNNPFGLSSTNDYAFTAFADVDNDGDMDVMVAEYYGNIQYFENTGSATMPSFSAPVVNPLGFVPATSASLLDIDAIDLDSDGDLDLLGGIYGNNAGEFHYYENNQIPTSSDTSITTVKNIDYTFNQGDFAFADADNSTFSHIIITTLPLNGTLNVSGNAVVAGDSITIADIPNLTYSPVMDSLGMPYDSLYFKVFDGGSASLNDYKITVLVDAPVSTYTTLGDAKLTIAPNPVQAQLNIELLPAEPIRQAQIAIVDYSGRMVYSEQLDIPGGIFRTTVDINQLPTGVYFLRITSDQEQIVKKIVKQ